MIVAHLAIHGLSGKPFPTVHRAVLVSVTNQTLTNNAIESNRLQPPERWLFWLLLVVSLVSLFYQLGTAGFFEPDEGRNAEKAREVLVLGDWVTPHENFFPVLDKPMFFYWLIAISYKVFGLSEWAARLPSALAAFGCFALVYSFARFHWGAWEALWSGLILISGIEFFILSRVVIFDMSLTFCITLVLYSFYQAAHAEERTRRRIYCILMYGALAGGTLIKGLVALLISGSVIFFYLLLTRQWSMLRAIYLAPGALLVLAIIAPWYLLTEARNAGFLRYYIWDEHFGRFATDSFGRKQPWFFFLGVLVVGFSPWSTLLPSVVKRLWSGSLDDKKIFLVLWSVLPLIFFSISSSKLPHYILPIFPALSILTATTLVSMFQNRDYNIKRPLATLWLLQSLNMMYLVSGLIWPAILPEQLRYSLTPMAWSIFIYATICLVILIALRSRKATGLWKSQSKVFVVHGLGALFFLIVLTQMMITVSRDRSAEEIAHYVAASIDADTQVVFYDTYLSGMPFYLGAQRPVWIVTHANKKKTVLGNFYVATHRAWPDTRWGKAIFDFDEFREAWNKNDRPLLIIVKQKNLSRMEKEIEASPRKLAAIDEYVLLSNQHLRDDSAHQ
jgi:4-amino-4-deoxy-L-arabinose transferase-like glycosyltransferase